LRPFDNFASSSALVLAALVGCNLHSGSGIDPNEIVEGGAADNQGDGGGMNTGSSGGGSGSSSGNMPQGTDAASAGSSSGGGSPNCGAMGPSACISCCEQEFPSGQSYQSALNACACGGGGGCASQCASELCANQPFASPGDACQQCVMGQSCYSQLQQNCSSNQGCQQYQGCSGGCPFSGSSSGGGSGSSSGGDGTDAGINPGQCPSNPSTCVDCCGQVDPAGYQAFLNDVGPCLCGDGGGDVCSTACAFEVCIGNPYASMDDGCEKCVNSNGGRGTTCFMLARQQCMMNSSCTSFMNCYGLCPAGSQ
jgi:hypothetical protein